MHPEKIPILLIAGTGQSPTTAFGSNYLAVLPKLGWDVCYVTLPDNGSGDIARSALLVANAISDVLTSSHQKLFLITHSQGGLEARWAVKHAAAAASGVEAIIELGAPNHGISLTTCQLVSCRQGAAQEMLPNSPFLDDLNAGTEVPGKAQYISIYSNNDDIVTSKPPSAALQGGTNISVQELCPGRMVSHAQLLTDAVVLAVVLRTLDTGSPQQPLGTTPPCGGSAAG